MATIFLTTSGMNVGAKVVCNVYMVLWHKNVSIIPLV